MDLALVLLHIIRKLLLHGIILWRQFRTVLHVYIYAVLVRQTLHNAFQPLTLGVLPADGLRIMLEHRREIRLIDCFGFCSIAHHLAQHALRRANLQAEIAARILPVVRILDKFGCASQSCIIKAALKCVVRLHILVVLPHSACIGLYQFVAVAVHLGYRAASRRHAFRVYQFSIAQMPAVAQVGQEPAFAFQAVHKVYCNILLRVVNVAVRVRGRRTGRCAFQCMAACHAFRALLCLVYALHNVTALAVGDAVKAFLLFCRRLFLSRLLFCRLSRLPYPLTFRLGLHFHRRLLRRFAVLHQLIQRNLFFACLLYCCAVIYTAGFCRLFL